jgi:hypothetical protein
MAIEAIGLPYTLPSKPDPQRVVDQRRADDRYVTDKAGRCTKKLVRRGGENPLNSGCSNPGP